MTGSEPAFPHMYDDGLTKRELFAAMAMQGILASPFRCESGFAELSVCAADQLIAELAKEDRDGK